MVPSVSNLLHSYDDPVYGVNIESEPHLTTVHVLPDSQNWSTIDIDHPYSRCINCDEVIIHSPTITQNYVLPVNSVILSHHKIDPNAYMNYHAHMHHAPLS